VEGLPTHVFPAEHGGLAMQCPTEIALSDRHDANLARSGLISLIHFKNTDYAAFLNAPSLQKPLAYDAPEATANASLAAKLPYVFAGSRFCHYVQCIARDKLGSFKELREMEDWLNRWIHNYVAADTAASEKARIRYPLGEAQIRLKESSGLPGSCDATLYLRPRYQMVEELTAAQRFVMRLPLPA
jgi:type VI secretion system protein ImpC